MVGANNNQQLFSIWLKSKWESGKNDGHSLLKYSIFQLNTTNIVILFNIIHKTNHLIKNINY